MVTGEHSPPMRLIFIPAHNEARTLPLVLERVRAITPTDVLIVDDGSHDGTAQVAPRYPNVRVVRHESRRGYGATMMTGFAWAAEHGYRTAVTLDADLQHDPADLPTFFDEGERVDVASGTRYHADSHVLGSVPPERRRINQVVTDWLRKATGYPITDGFCGYKAYRVEAVSRLPLTETGPAFPIEFWVLAAHAGLSVVEVPTSRIYLDADRRFGGGLDQADARLAYYRKVLEQTQARIARKAS